jgi:hypothetical protein
MNSKTALELAREHLQDPPEMDKLVEQIGNVLVIGFSTEPGGAVVCDIGVEAIHPGQSYPEYISIQRSSGVEEIPLRYSIGKVQELHCAPATFEAGIAVGGGGHEGITQKLHKRRV